MKIKTGQFVLTYRNHNNKMTRRPYDGIVYGDPVSAKEDAQEFKKVTKKNMKVAELVFETVE